MTEPTTPTTDPAAMQIAARVGRSLEQAQIDPVTGRLPTPPAPQRPAPGPMLLPKATPRESAGAGIRQHAERERAELRAFVKAVADHFGCKDLVSDHWMLRLKQPFEEVRRYVQQRKAEAERARRDRADDRGDGRRAARTP